MCSKASNQSDRMQHNVPAAIFSHGTIFCVRRGQRSMFLAPAVSPSHWTRRRLAQQHLLRSATQYAFGASSVFRWNFSVDKNFGVLLQCTNLQLRCTQSSFSLAPPAFSLAPLSFALAMQQMAAVNFVHFYFVKWFVKMDRKVTSNIKLKNI